MQKVMKFLKSLFKKDKNNGGIKKIYLIDFSNDHISTGQVGGYILMLREKYGITMLGYEYKSEYRCSTKKPGIGGVGRFAIYTWENNTLKTFKYFEDRCPAIVEKECMETKPAPHKFRKWGNDFEEVVPYDFNV